MMNKKSGLLAVFILTALTVMISACTQSLSSAPVATPTLIPAELFVSPFPSVENPMAMIEEFAKQTAVAQTAAAGGATPETPQPIESEQPPVTQEVGTPTNAEPQSAAEEPLVNATPVPEGVRPATYTLQQGEFPFCIARRFNVDPDAMLRASGLTRPDVYYPGLSLTIPQSGAFPGSRMLATHPTTYTVASAQETLYSIACKFGDVDPAAIASANGISVSTKLTAGQQLQIP
ncbi:MAG: LysM peptidoglycan-binding domain-containing protein [Chloroflexi bacterium]|nr:LysM peptidoglycan-binding domain-containing protein [Chloroflexota bacterium]